MTTTRPLSLMDASFFVMETAVTPLHMGGASIFRLPEDAGKDYVRRLYERWSGFPVNRAPFSFRLAQGLLSTVRPQWEVLDSVDISQHLFRVAVPHPGGNRDLEELIARLHGRQLDRGRPLWEIYLIEGLSDHRFAMYTKIHHSLADGATAVRLFGDQFTGDPKDRSTRPVWTQRRAAGRRSPPSAEPPRSLLQDFPLTPTAARAFMGRAYRGAGKAMTLVTDLKEAPISADAPDSIFNLPITARREVGQAVFDFARVKGLSRAIGCTINDIALTVCGGALRRYLQGIDALPGQSLVCAVPIALNKEGNAEGGNAVTAAPVAIGTNVADVRERFAAVRDSMRDVKAQMAKISPDSIALATAIFQLPVVVEQVTGRWPLPRRLMNVILSNVPGPRERLYMGGAEFLGSIPLPMILRGMGLNITITSLVDRIWFSYTSCPDIAPHIDRLGPLITESFDELERVMTRPQRRASARRAERRRPRARAN